MCHDVRRNNDKTSKAWKKSSSLKLPEFFWLSVPCTNKDQRPSICSSCPFLHWRLQGLRGLCCKWCQTGLGFTRAYRQREIEHERGKMMLVHPTVLSLLVWTHTGLWLPDCFLQQIRVCVCCACVWQFSVTIQKICISKYLDTVTSWI